MAGRGRIASIMRAGKRLKGGNYDESLHPRGPGGKFASKGGAGRQKTAGLIRKVRGAKTEGDYSKLPSHLKLAHEDALQRAKSNVARATQPMVPTKSRRAEGGKMPAYTARKRAEQAVRLRAIRRAIRSGQKPTGSDAVLYDIKKHRAVGQANRAKWAYSGRKN